MRECDGEHVAALNHCAMVHNASWSCTGCAGFKESDMRKLSSVGVVVVLSLITSVAFAGGRYGGPGWGWSPPRPVAAPEIDPASASSALTLLIGGLAVLRSRSRRRDK